MNILHIDSSILGDASVTRPLGRRLVERLLAENPGANVTYRDLAADPIPHLSGAYLAAKSGAATDADFTAEIALGDAVIAEFLAADAIVIASPMYNFSISSQLKAWIDRVCQAGVTFGYTAQGPVGLVADKPVYLVTGRGSAFVPGSPVDGMDFQTPYLKAVLGFVGITDVTVVHAEGLALSPDARGTVVAAAEAAIDTLPLPAQALELA
ncbi:FMN-dependent NADH-azoreductase [Novosphingobium sp. PhB165]|uniref:FMN-dependent NADH-azoreductase n=1 Tax=Novosphingobium sp. PhB165 TaxID=2485105 RepID=UPI001052ED83|nr:FMN-dependent NADH-azoreductase [Novosphingobium sp. PhB165]TCM20848.1 FMN-dependent NADH-azoreductase [Novosphingobium sp. PhB165]